MYKKGNGDQVSVKINTLEAHSNGRGGGMTTELTISITVSVSQKKLANKELYSIS